MVEEKGQFSVNSFQIFGKEKWVNGSGTGTAATWQVFGAVPENVLARARLIKLLLTDCDGVLTDGGVYYSARGEEMKRFSIRDGMGVERLRTLAGVEVGIISGEMSPSLMRRADKLSITILYLGVKDKTAVLRQILQFHPLQLEEVAYIGDDTNDVELMRQVGLAACPADAVYLTRAAAHYVSAQHGGHGAFRDFAELIIFAKRQKESSWTEL
jgi:3-deoxy-D-manno-octulosonate 8-phosphate phosphatase (KDO 8-P phosphatase)